MKTNAQITTMILSLFLNCMTFAQVDLGGDIVSRYVWRGTDFGNAACIQPYLSLVVGGLEIGAWASYPLCTVVGANENDLHISYDFGNVGLTLNDYYFPEGLDLFNYASDSVHVLEASAFAEFGAFSVLAAANLWGDDDNSMYTEVGYDFYEKDDISVSAFAGLGNGFYTLDGEFNLVNLGISASKGDFSVSFIVNPDAMTDYLVLGYSIPFKDR